MENTSSSIDDHCNSDRRIKTAMFEYTCASILSSIITIAIPFVFPESCIGKSVQENLQDYLNAVYLVVPTYILSAPIAVYISSRLYPDMFRVTNKAT